MVLLVVVVVMMMAMMMIKKLYSNNNFNGKYLATVSPETAQTIWITKGLL